MNYQGLPFVTESVGYCILGLHYYLEKSNFNNILQLSSQLHFLSTYVKLFVLYAA